MELKHDYIVLFLIFLTFVIDRNIVVLVVLFISCLPKELGAANSSLSRGGFSE